MGMIDHKGNEVVHTPNIVADRAAADAHAAWQASHADDVPVLPTFDASGIQTNKSDRLEEVVAQDGKSFVVTQFTDGTVRKDNTSPVKLEAIKSQISPMAKPGEYRVSAAERLEDRSLRVTYCTTDNSSHSEGKEKAQ